MKRSHLVRIITIAIQLMLWVNLLGAAELPDTLPRPHSFWRELFSSGTPQVTQPTKLALNWVDQGFDWKSCFVLPVDDWGVKGVIMPGGLPPYCIKIYQDELPAHDPLYGQLPLTWLNFRSDSVKYTASNRLDLWTSLHQPTGVLSWFDYYRGDYNFLNFALYAEGNIKPNQAWRFSGENIAYDGYYGLLGADRSKQGESISQSYRANFSTRMVYDSPWRIDIGAVYQKYLPGLIKSIPSGIALRWIDNGKLTEYRAQLQANVVRQNSSRKTALGGVITTWVYGSYPTDGLGAFKGIANQQYTFFEQGWSGSRWQKTVRLSHYYQVLQLRRRAVLNDQVVEGQLYLSRADNPGRALRLGFQKAHFSYEIDWNWQLSRSWRTNVNLARDYFLYPQIYRANLPNWQPIEKEGTTVSQQSAGIAYTHNQFGFALNLMHPKGEFYIPRRQSYSDTLITFEMYHPKALMVSIASTYTAPWRMRLSLNLNGNSEVWQWSGHLQQHLSLFKDNLQLYLTSETIYWQGAGQWGWFEEIRSLGRIQVKYFTNNRLVANVRVDAYVGDLHLFYLVNNVEGRAFSTISGMPFRNMLRLFGVEWTFLN